jgi:CheY-like chemotaxis protein
VTATVRTLVILIVDDDPGDVLLMTQALDAAGHASAVHVVGNGPDALAFLHRTGRYAQAPRPQLVLLDLNLPGQDGRQVLEEIKFDAQLSRTPVLVFSTSADPEDIRAAYSRHANAYVTKPSELDDFTSTIAAIGEFFAQIARVPA